MALIFLKLIADFQVISATTMRIFITTGDWMPLAVAFVAGLSMAVFEYVSRKRNITWLDNFSMAGSMLIGMAAAIGLGAL